MPWWGLHRTGSACLVLPGFLYSCGTRLVMAAAEHVQTRQVPRNLSSDYRFPRVAIRTVRCWRGGSLLPACGSEVQTAFHGVPCRTPAAGAAARRSAVRRPRRNCTSCSRPAPLGPPRSTLGCTGQASRPAATSCCTTTPTPPALATSPPVGRPRSTGRPPTSAPAPQPPSRLGGAGRAGPTRPRTTSSSMRTIGCPRRPGGRRSSGFGL